jgi:hypothetical protein
VSIGWLAALQAISLQHSTWSGDLASLRRELEHAGQLAVVQLAYTSADGKPQVISVERILLKFTGWCVVVAMAVVFYLFFSFADRLDDLRAAVEDLGRYDDTFEMLKALDDVTMLDIFNGFRWIALFVIVVGSAALWMTSRRIRFLGGKRLALLPLVLTFNIASCADGGITGTVVDSTGTDMPGATVTAVLPWLSTEWVEVADDGGRFRSPALMPPGRYLVRCEISGFRAEVTQQWFLWYWIPADATVTLRSQSTNSN